MNKINNKANVFHKYLLKKYLLVIFIVNTISSIGMSIFVGLESVTQDGNTMPLPFWLRNMLLLNSLSILVVVIFLFIFIKRKTEHISTPEEKIVFFEKNKDSFENRFYISLFILMIPFLIVSGNTMLDSDETTNISCNINSKEITETKKGGKTYIINAKCNDKSEYDLRVTGDTWNRKKEASSIILTTTKGGLGFQRIKKITY
ncbi:MAG: hypothetical protein AABZ74_14890 [Cyanobacteriota bacterium]